MVRDNIILVSFDFPKSDYDFRSYSISSILASLKKHKISASHYCININQELEKSLLTGNDLWSIDLKTCVQKSIDAIIVYLKKFDYIAIGVSRWSKDYAKYLVEKLRKSEYHGKIICGSYEITAAATATNYNDLVKKFGDADYFIKGYAEKPLVKLIKEKCDSSNEVLIGELDPILDSEYLASPYQEGIIPLYSRKVYWETKRGCPYDCGFCEWGNCEINKKIIYLDKKVLKKDIELFSNSNVEEINILDGTFNTGNNYLSYLSDLLEKTDCKITFQARFEAIKGKYKTKFMNLCEKYKDKVHLEFGLQTIHKNEIDEINRKGAEIDSVERCLRDLKEREIPYEVSIIYAIPGQTIDSFIDTIEFLKINGCKKIRAFPLQIPNNYKNKDSVGEQQKDIYNVESVARSNSFTKFDRYCMDIIAEHLNEVSELKPSINLIKEKNEDFGNLMKIIDRYKRKIHFKDTKFDLVYSIDNEVLKKYERNKGLLGIRYIPFLCIDYINKYFRSEEKKNSNISHCDYYDEREVPNDKLKELIDKKVMDKGYNIKLSPVIRIGESGDFYVYAKAICY